MKNVYITDQTHKKLELIKKTEKERLGYNISYCQIVSDLITQKFDKMVIKVAPDISLAHTCGDNVDTDI